MIIEVENNSSPGASFTKNTNDVLVTIYEWICENKGTEISFSEFRKRLEKEKRLSNDNNRNIMPLLKNCGFVSYISRGSMSVDEFYTNKGLAYVKTLQIIQILENADFLTSQMKCAIQKLRCILKELIYDGLINIVRSTDANYIEPLQDLIGFLLKFGKLSKVEYAYLLYVQHTKEKSVIENGIYSHREGKLEFDVFIKVRDGINKGTSRLTSYGYFTSLLMEAGLLRKDNEYCYVIEEKRDKLKILGGICDER